VGAEKGLFGMRTLVSQIVALGPVGLANCMLSRSVRLFHAIRTRAAEEYRNPSDAELASIETRLLEMGILCTDFFAEVSEFEEFNRLAGFPTDYHGGTGTRVYREKLLEHFVAWKFLCLDNSCYTPYVDVAAGGSPWALLLRNSGVDACAIDITISPEFISERCYLQQDATRTGFENGTVGSASLQCAYEMFSEGQDVAFLYELGRILKPGGRAVISPLYTHTHACYYQTPDYYGTVPGDPETKRYIRRDCWGVPFSRKYSPETLKARVWDNALNAGLLPSLHVLRNKYEIGDGIYLYFILVLDKPLTVT
jgi:hypothetical protein